VICVVGKVCDFLYPLKKKSIKKNVIKRVGMVEIEMERGRYLYFYFGRMAGT
jgi:hypothetical protein